MTLDNIGAVYGEACKSKHQIACRVFFFVYYIFLDPQQKQFQFICKKNLQDHRYMKQRDTTFQDVSVGTKQPQEGLHDI